MDRTELLGIHDLTIDVKPDYVDNYVPMLASMYERRLKGYAAIGYVIERDESSTQAASCRLVTG